MWQTNMSMSCQKADQCHANMPFQAVAKRCQSNMPPSPPSPFSLKCAVPAEKRATEAEEELSSVMAEKAQLQRAVTASNAELSDWQQQVNDLEETCSTLQVQIAAAQVSSSSSLPMASPWPQCTRDCFTSVLCSWRRPQGQKSL